MQSKSKLKVAGPLFFGRNMRYEIYSSPEGDLLIQDGWRTVIVLAQNAKWLVTTFE